MALTALTLVFGAAPAAAQSGPGDGSFPLVLDNDTGGRWADDEIFVTVLGMPEPGQWGFLRPSGRMAPLDHTMADAPGHLTKDGRNYADMSFTLAEVKGTVRIPPHVQGGRAYISVGSPMYIGIASDDQGWAGPVVTNPSDPNYDVTFDWYEFTYVNGEVPFGGNTTQVDQFAIPMTARVQQRSSDYDRTSGIRLSRQQIWSRWDGQVAKAFEPLATKRRIVAPRTSPAFHGGGDQAGYLDGAIDAAWAQWRDGFELTRLNQTFKGRVADGKLVFTKDGKGPFEVAKPSTEDVFECSGALASAGMSTTALELGAELCAAFNRGVAGDTSDWYRPRAYYPAGARDNDYAKFFHAISIDDRSYAFAYDDINDQSSVLILPNAEPPTKVTLSIGW